MLTLHIRPDEDTSVETAADAGREPIGWRQLAWALAVCTVVWVPLFVLRVQAHQANVDDYLYATITRSIGDRIDIVQSILHTGQTAPLVPTLGAVGVRVAGLYGAMAVQLPILLMAAAGAFLLARTWLSPTASMVTALAVGLNSEMLGYAVMLHFAVACTAGILWTFAAYFRSGRFRTWGWSIVFAIAVAALLLSRSVSPIYVAPAALVIAIDLVLDLRARGMRSLVPIVVALGVVVVLAGPWWLVSGPAALHYLVSAGYQSSGGYISQGGARFNPSAMVGRIRSELNGLGWGEAWALGVAIVIALVATVTHWAEVRKQRAGLLVAFVVLSVAILMTSANSSTALGLPILAVLIEVCAVPIALLSSRWLRVVLPAAAGVLLVGILFLASPSENSWWPPAPYRNAIIQAGGSSRTDSDLIEAQVARFIGSKPTLVVKGDPVLNANGLLWNLGPRQHLINPPLGLDETAFSLRSLRNADVLVTGMSPFSFYLGLDVGAVSRAAIRDGFAAVRAWRVSPTNSVVVWERVPKGETVPLLDPRPTTKVTFTELARGVPGTIFGATASDPEGGSLSVHFVVTGPGLAAPEIEPASPSYYYGYVGGWRHSGVPAGTYTVRSVATSNIDGETGTSAPVSFTIGG